MTRHEIGEGVTVWHGDALAVMPTLPDASVDLVLCDPPYFRVKSAWWDRQWDTDAGFLAWVGQLCEQWRRLLKPNGSLYVFASPRMAAKVELEVGRRFNVLNRVTWIKNNGDVESSGGKWRQTCKEDLRSFFPRTESIVFAEQYGSDESYNGALVTENAPFFTACETAKRGIFGDYLRSEFQRAGVTNREIAALFPSATGGLTGCVSNWLLGYNCPTPEQYQRMREHLNAKAAADDYLRREYEELRREYEELRREYEELRRPFYASPSAPYTDVWDFPTVGDYPGKHPCEKPLPLLRHVIGVSSRSGAVVLDSTCGSGSTLVAAKEMGRQAVGIEIEDRWVRRTIRRVSQATFDWEPPPEEPVGVEMPSLFREEPPA